MVSLACSLRETSYCCEMGGGLFQAAPPQAEDEWSTMADTGVVSISQSSSQWISENNVGNGVTKMTDRVGLIPGTSCEVKTCHDSPDTTGAGSEEKQGCASGEDHPGEEAAEGEGGDHEDPEAGQGAEDDEEDLGSEDSEGSGGEEEGGEEEYNEGGEEGESEEESEVEEEEEEAEGTEEDEEGDNGADTKDDASKADKQQGSVKRSAAEEEGSNQGPPKQAKKD